jgi:hypothetical protein
MIGMSRSLRETIMRLAGHSSIVISQRYVHPTGERIENAITKMGQANRKADAKREEEKK